jgi:hypothetical protein
MIPEPISIARDVGAEARELVLSNIVDLPKKAAPNQLIGQERCKKGVRYLFADKTKRTRKVSGTLSGREIKKGD